MIRFLFLLILSIEAKSQTIGGQTVFTFLNLPPAPQVTALGGINISNTSKDVGPVFVNPSLLRSDHHGQMQVAYNSFIAGIRNYFVEGAYHLPRWETTFALGVHYFDYGSILETDPAGNVLGELQPSDFVLQLSASREYSSRIRYGAALKWIHSNYGSYKAAGVALDVAGFYTDTTHLFQVSLLLKNMGVQYKAYTGTDPGDLPFDIQLGISKKLQHAPVQFSLTLHHLHHFDIRYNDTLFNETGNDDRSYFFDKLFRHVVLGTQLYIKDNIEISAGYNHLRRKELAVGSGGNGLNGFSMGLGILFRKFQFRYSKAWYQQQKGYHQFGINVDLK